MPNIPALVQTEDKNLIRDTRSKALLTTDSAALSRHRAARAKRQQHTAAVENELKTLRADVARLTELVQQLLKNG